MTGIGKFFTTPSLLRTLVIIAILVLIFLIIYWWRSSRKKRQQEELFNKDYDQLVQGGQKPTYLATNYSQYADKIYEAGCSGFLCYGTDEDAIYGVFDKMKNELDTLLLVKAFGLRQPRGGICIPLPGTGECDYPLGQWLQTELGEDEFKEINNILTKKGIKFQF